MQPPGWYGDPWGQAPLRWWDGTQWTGAVSAAAHPPVATGGASTGWMGYGDDADTTLRSAERVGRWLRKVLLLLPVVAVVGTLSFGFLTRELLAIVRDIESLDQEDPNVPIPAGWMVGAQLLSPLSVVVLVLRMVWTYQASRTAKALALPLRRDSGLACAAWIIPIVNLWWPYQAVRDVLAPEQREGSRLGWWWGLYLASSLAPFLGASMGATGSTGAITVGALAAGAAAAASALIERNLIERAHSGMRARLAGHAAASRV